MTTQIGRLSHEVAVLNTKIARLVAGPAPTMRATFGSLSKKRDVGNLLMSASSHGSFAKAAQRPVLGSDALFSKVLAKGEPEYDPDQARDEDGKWSSGGGSTTPQQASRAERQRARNYDYRMSMLKKIGLGIVVVGGVYLLLRSGRSPLALKPSMLTTPLGRQVPILGHGATRAEAHIAAAVDMIPAAHFQALKASGIRFAAIKDMGSINAWGNYKFTTTVYGVFDTRTNIMVVPQSVSVFGLRKSISERQAVNSALHEMGHAIDNIKGDVGAALGWSTRNAIIEAELKTPAAAAYRAHLTKNNYLPYEYNSEVFADVYAAMYFKGADFTRMMGIKNSEIVAAFPNTSKAIDGLSMPTSIVMPKIRRAPNDLEDWLTRGSRKRAVRKGDPEFNPDQPRDEDGRWTAGSRALLAGGALAATAAGGIGVRGVLARRAAQRVTQQAQGRRSAEAWLGGKPVAGGSLQMGKLTSAEHVRNRMTAFFPDATLGFSRLEHGAWAGLVKQGDDLKGLFVLDPSKQQLFVNFMHTSDSTAGFDAAKRYMLMLLSFARDSGAKSINAVASMEMGGYAWPRAGFELTERSAGMVRLAITSRFGELSSKLTPAQRMQVSEMLRHFDKHTPAKLARLDDAVPASVMRAAGDVRGKPTLGKALLAKTEGEYVLPRSKFAPMGKALAKALGFTKGYLFAA